MSFFPRGEGKYLERIAIALEAILDLQRANLGVVQVSPEAEEEEEDFSWLAYTNEEKDAADEAEIEERERLGVRE